VYKTLWVNPHPEKKIDKIVITDAGLIPDQQRFVAHLAITLAMAPTGGPAAIVGDPAKASALIAEATKRIEAKDTKGALEKLAAALAADPANTGAWEVLTRLRANTDDVRTFTGLCQRWMTADPKNYQPYNTLAAFLETKGQKEEALKLYKRSLEIEWNQPPAGEAVRRLEKELKK
jgi:Tfp pilus assembly protein PilF